MARIARNLFAVWCLWSSLGLVSAQDVMYDSGSMAGAILGTFFVTLLLVAIAYLVYRYYWKNRKDKNLVLVNDPENVKDEFAFDNPGFKTDGGGGWLRSQVPPPLTKTEGKDNSAAHPPPSLGPNPVLTPNRPGNFKDDTYLENTRGRTMVPLWSRDFTGLGFEVSGGMRDGIHVSSVLRGGPAAESGRIHPGDRINSITISFRHMVYEDAVAILSYASPYELRLEVESNDGTLPGRDPEQSRHILAHPKLRRVASQADVSYLEKLTRNHHSPKSQKSPNSTLDSKNTSTGSAIKKMITEKIHPSTLERIKQHGHKDKKDIHHMTTLERENEKNAKNNKHIELSPKFDKVKQSLDLHISKPERNNRQRNSTEITIGNVNQMSSPPDVIIIKDGGDKYSAKVDKAEVQKKEPEGKKGMKFGIRVLPPNIPDDGTILSNRNSKNDDFVKIGAENGNIVAEIRSIDEVDKNFEANKDLDESFKVKTAAPIVAKRREKPLAPIPNARHIPQNNILTSPAHIEIKMDVSSPEKSAEYENISFDRSDDLNSSGIKRDAQGIPQEIPKHMMEAALYARNNRKSSSELAMVRNSTEVVPKKEPVKIEIKNEKESQASKNNKKSKGKAPSPPDAFKTRDDQDVSNDNENNSNMTQETIINITNINNMNFTDNFDYHNVSNVQQTNPSSINRSDDMILSKVNTSTPKVEKVTKRMRPDIPTQKPLPIPQIEMQDDIELYDGKSFHKKEASDSLNNYFDDSKSNISSNMDGHSIISLSQDSFASNLNHELDKIANSSTTIELNSSDITIHSSPTNELETSTQELNDNERKAASLGDLSRLEPVDKNCRKPSPGTLERAQSLDITSEDAKMNGSEKHITPKKRKSNSVFDGNLRHNTSDELPVDSNENVSQILCQLKEPRLSLNINNISMEGLSTFQRNRLKKASEWGNLEDAILIKKDLSHSGSSELGNSEENINQSELTIAKASVVMALDEETDKLNEGDKVDHVQRVTNVIGEESVENIPQKIKDLTEGNVANKIQLPEETTVTLTSPDNIQPLSDSLSNTVDYYKVSIVKSDIQPKVKSPETFESRPNFEIGTYVSDPNNINKYKTETVSISSSRLSPKLEDKLTMIYDTNIPDDIKVSRHTLVSSLERPKSDLMKKLLAQNPALNVGSDKQEQNISKTDTEKNEHADEIVMDNSHKASDKPHEKTSVETKTNATSFTLLNQPDIVNLRIKQNPDEAVDTYDADYISSINVVGTTAKDEPSPINFDFNSQYTAVPEKTRNIFSSNDNVITISTDGSQPSSIITIEGDPSGVQAVVDNFKNSIEIKTDFDKSKEAQITPNEDSQRILYNEIMSQLEKENAFNHSENLPIITANTKTYLIEGDEKDLNHKAQYLIDTKTLEIPGQKTVSVNVSEDEMGNKIITQNIEETVTRVVTVSAAPIEVEEYTFGIIKNPTEADYKRIEEMEAQNIDTNILTDIEMQNPNIKFLSTNPLYTDSQTMTLNANMSEEDAKMFIEKLKANPGIMMADRSDHSPGIKIKESAVVVEEKGSDTDPHKMIKMTQASYKFKEDDGTHPMKIIKVIESGGKVHTEAEEQLTTEEINRIVDKINEATEMASTEFEEDFDKTEYLTNSQHTQDIIDNYKMEGTKSPVSEYITEIEVRTPKSETSSKQNAVEEKMDARHNNRVFQEIDPSFMGDFLNMERRFSEKEKLDSDNFERRKSYSDSTSQNGIQKKHSTEDKPKRHSDFDLPRNTHIKFRTATYEPLTVTPNKLTSSEKRLSQIEILKSNFEKGSSESLTSPKPLISTKPSNIPIKLPEKNNSTHKSPVTSPSKIPVLHSSNPKVNSQENISEKRTSPHNKNPVLTGNITVTSIKSSRNPSGK